MCGIAGIVDLAGEHTPADATILRMNDALRHRGPDGSGVVLLPGLGFGHRRLAVIDIATGAQPMASGELLITYNGEVYNFRELRCELEAMGHRFVTRSDTEVLLAGWRAWGTSLLDRLNGMFAFALWDGLAQTLLLARDRLGEKPLYYAWDRRGRLVFASEIDAIVCALEGTPALNREAVADYLAFGYVPDPRAIWQGVHKLAPGHFLLLRRYGPRAVPVRYWRPQFGARRTGGLDELAEELLVRLDRSVRRRLVADVPLGAFLSGGVDSGGVVALMAGASERPVVTCTLGFAEREFDESAAAASIAQRYRTDHRARSVELDASTTLDQLAAVMGEPFADASALPNLVVAELARKRVTVALSGDGGDEVFAGYRRYASHRRDERIKAFLPESARTTVLGPLARWWPKLDWVPRPLRAKATLETLASDTAHGYLRCVTVIPPGDWARVISRGLAGYDPGDVLAHHLAQADTDDPLAQAQYVDLMTWLPGRMLVKVDRTSMAHALEVRPPFLDYELVEWAAGLPSSAKLAHGSGKAVLKRALRSLLDEQIITGRKRGFGIPVRQWLRQGLRPRLREIDRGGRLFEAGIVERSGYRTVVAEHDAGHRDHSQLLWTLIMLDAFLARSDRLAATRRTA